ncbi:MAG TPA: cytochrome c maturation protein CcmE [Candidatus Latescibacteria bacterium]|nr:cytochrome c maturation protein CcmE [Candidatus Latescibacterota bacterium]
MRKPGTKVLISLGLIAAAIAILVVAATMRQGATIHYYTTTSEFLNRAPDYINKPVRVNGKVVPGSLERVGSDGPTDLRFALGDSVHHTLPVHYRGTALPDAFREGADVVVEGVYLPTGVLEARQILAKCPSKYEAAPANR